MGTVLSGMSLLLALAIAVALVALAPRHAPRIRFRSRARASVPAVRRRPSGYSTLGYAFNFTLSGAGLLITGLIGYRLRRGRGVFASRWSDDYIWWQILLGLALACAAVVFWRKGLRELNSRVLIPEVVDGERDTRLPPSRRIR